MAQKVRHHLAPVKSGLAGMEPKELSKLEFSRRLNKLMLDKGWNQSDLARAAGVGRDAISTYIRGRSFPEPKSLRKLADALDAKTEDLLPNTVAAALDADTSPMLEIKQAAGHPEQVWIRVNRMVTFDQAARIFEIIKESERK